MMMSIKNLTAFYDQEKNILEDVSLEIGDNQIVGLIGANGSGKTTFINCLSGVHRSYAVEEVYFHEDETSFSNIMFKFKRYIVYTESSAFGYWNFDKYCKYIAKSYNCEIDQLLLDELLAGFNFTKYRETKIRELSTGNKKKCFLITGLLLRLPLLILDEPFDGLDYVSSEFLIEQINEYRKYGSILMSSHIAETFTRTCDSITVLNDHRFTQWDINCDTDIKQLMSQYVA